MKKHFEIYKLNRQIDYLNRQMVEELGSDTVLISGGMYSMPATRYRTSEKSTVIRESINRLKDQRDLLKKS